MNTPDDREFSLYWQDDGIVAVDQLALPQTLRLMHLKTVDSLIEAIHMLAIRGAPALGLAGALGVALSARCHQSTSEGWREATRADAARLANARPTAVNLAWGVEQALSHLHGSPDTILDAVLKMIAEDAATNRLAVTNAAREVRARTPSRPLRILTHCNTGRLATAAVGTALGTILHLAGEGKVTEVLVDETRPLMQGSRLTAWELSEASVPYRICIDSAAAAAMSRGLVDCVLVGADRIARNGDTANKIGTYGLAVAAARHCIPFFVVAPESTWDSSLDSGDAIEIEERDPGEVTSFSTQSVAPADARVFNPAFDVTPAELITAIITERRVVHPAARSCGSDAETEAVA
ncbi:S-methyl-5-thioribose-1-phosphate isomerase [Streptomyces sp. NPDC003023]|uniref:S-methyl-5-thioribose-1-phosphate isomerase n=1 Tax=Streptomyces sp. NPDC003023 TaxID=3364675 RepID=UPI00368B58E5